VQKSSQDEVLSLIQRDYDAVLMTQTVNGTDYSKAQISGKPAEMLLSRIAKHLVVKRYQANMVLDRLHQPVGDHDAFKAWLKEVRRVKSLPIPNYPARKWLAGFFDGDGCLSVQDISKHGAAIIVVVIASADYDTESLELIHKAFGGNIHGIKDKPCKQWKLTMQPSKAMEFLGHFAKYSIVKKSQIDFILGCAEMGHFRDGKSIKDGLKQLKAREHRLSETGFDVKELLKTVRDIPKRWCFVEGYEACIDCGTTRNRYYAKGLCSVCYQRRFKSNRAIVGAANAAGNYGQNDSTICDL
jgi:hypothetical protein